MKYALYNEYTSNFREFPSGFDADPAIRRSGDSRNDIGKSSPIEAVFKAEKGTACKYNMASSHFHRVLRRKLTLAEACPFCSRTRRLESARVSQGYRHTSAVEMRIMKRFPLK